MAHRARHGKRNRLTISVIDRGKREQKRRRHSKPDNALSKVTPRALFCLGHTTATGEQKFEEGSEACAEQGPVLLTDAIQIGTQGLVSEVALPQAGRKEVDLLGGMGIDALEHIDQIDVGIDPLEPARG
jgi:hypothetical protein